MNRKCCVVLVTAVLAAGCGVAPEETAEKAPVAETAQDSVAETTAGATNATQGADTSPRLMVDLRDLAPGNTGVTCRDTLKQGSNVIVTYCMTAADWKTFYQRQMRQAQEMLRAMQSGRYR